MLDWSQLPIELARADLAADAFGFFRTMSYYLPESGPAYDWRSIHGTTSGGTIPANDRVVVHGDVDGELRLESEVALFVRGHVRGRVRTGSSGEIVVTGDVKAGAAIGGHFSLFVGGNMDGSLRTKGCSTVWVLGHLTGNVRTGTPFTRVTVRGDCSGSFRPDPQRGMLNLDVAGYMTSGAVEAIAAAGYTKFHASIGVSDQPAGLYPSLERHQTLGQLRSYVRWVIHRMRDGLSPSETKAPEPAPGS